jgi:hypothetical protein
LKAIAELLQMDFHHINMAGLLQMASHHINVLGGDDILEGTTTISDVCHFCWN